MVRPNLIEVTFVFVFVSSVLLLLSIKLSIFPNESGLQHVSPIPWTKTIKSCFCCCCCCPREQKRKTKKTKKSTTETHLHLRHHHLNIAALLFCAPPCLLIARSFSPHGGVFNKNRRTRTRLSRNERVFAFTRQTCNTLFISITCEAFCAF